MCKTGRESGTVSICCCLFSLAERRCLCLDTIHWQLMADGWAVARIEWSLTQSITSSKIRTWESIEIILLCAIEQKREKKTSLESIFICFPFISVAYRFDAYFIRTCLSAFIPVSSALRVCKQYQLQCCKRIVPGIFAAEYMRLRHIVSVHSSRYLFPWRFLIEFQCAGLWWLRWNPGAFINQIYSIIARAKWTVSNIDMIKARENSPDLLIIMSNSVECCSFTPWMKYWIE